MLYLLDTDHLSLVYRRTLEGIQIVTRLRKLSTDDYGISIVTYAEAAKGWLAQVARAHAPAEEVTAFGRMQESLQFCTSFAIWEYTPEAAAHCAELRKQKIGMGTQDMRIAAIALTNNATLLTRNARDFARVPGLLFADWSA